MRKLCQLFVGIALMLIFFMASPASAIDLKLTWNHNTETDLAGYRIHRASTPGGPYF